MKDVILDLDGHSLTGTDAGRERAPADIVDESRKARIADEIEGRPRCAKRGSWGILPALEEDRFDDVH
jgi:hypothetical protein